MRREQGEEERSLRSNPSSMAVRSLFCPPLQLCAYNRAQNMHNAQQIVAERVNESKIGDCSYMHRKISANVHVTLAASGKEVRDAGEQV